MSNTRHTPHTHLFSWPITDPPPLGFTDSKVGRLEEALSAARIEVAEASAASERAKAGRDKAEARIVRLDAAKLETAREVWCACANGFLSAKTAFL